MDHGSPSIAVNRIGHRILADHAPDSCPAEEKIPEARAKVAEVQARRRLGAGRIMLLPPLSPGGVMSVPSENVKAVAATI
ncbi:MAG: hypothetical protein LAT50_07885, partial [Ectothiorhodospiraceae bacterium]|nr:hypothetical protein [Ectothiorhodospiraceae bacterium]